MAKKRASTKAAKKGGKASPIGPFALAGSPITVDGGGSIKITFDDAVYVPVAGTDDHDHKTGQKLKRLTIGDASLNPLDFSKHVSANPDLCLITVFYVDDTGEFKAGIIKIKGGPKLGINFDKAVFSKTPAGEYYNAKTRITKVEVGYPGGWGKTTFEQPTIGKCQVAVNFI